MKCFFSLWITKKKKKKKSIEIKKCKDRQTVPVYLCEYMNAVVLP